VGQALDAVCARAGQELLGAVHCPRSVAWKTRNIHALS
jgi:hypothetical protein